MRTFIGYKYKKHFMGALLHWPSLDQSVRDFLMGLMAVLLLPVVLIVGGAEAFVRGIVGRPYDPR